MNYDAVMFDLDGTLLPMDYDVFAKGYFKALASKLSPLGIEAEALIAAVWTGTKAMMKNDGTKPNIDAFWDTFSAITGKERSVFEPVSDEFYVNEFHDVKKLTSENISARTAVEQAHRIAKKVVLASNPLFPRNGQLTRMSWVGLGADDFDHITSYETESFCKPDPRYYLEICKKLEISPEKCLMVGNDVREDMKAATEAGFSGYLVTDCIIPCSDYTWNGPSGSFEQLLDFLK